MIYTQRLHNALNKDVNKGNEIYTKAVNHNALNKDVNKGNDIYTKATQRVEQRCKQRQ